MWCSTIEVIATSIRDRYKYYIKFYYNWYFNLLKTNKINKSISNSNQKFIHNKNIITLILIFLKKL